MDCCACCYDKCATESDFKHDFKRDFRGAEDGFQPGDLVVRTVAEADAERLFQLDRRCFAPSIAYTRAEIISILRRRDGFHVSLEAEAECAGFILTIPNQKRGHVITIDVDAAYRRRGVGQRLLGAAEAHYRARRMEGMRLEVAVNNFPALRFYARLGYRLVRRLPGYYAQDLDGLRLDKDWGDPG